MDSNKQTDEKRPVESASRVLFCQRKKSDNGSFASDFRTHFDHFLRASTEEHKICLRITIQKVLARMDSNNKQTDENRPVKSASRVSFCQRKMSDNGSFVSSLRDHFHQFIRASAEEHKTCLRHTLQKILDESKFLGKNGDSTNEGDSVPLQSNRT